MMYTSLIKQKTTTMKFSVRNSVHKTGSSHAAVTVTVAVVQTRDHTGNYCAEGGSQTGTTVAAAADSFPVVVGT